MGFGKSGRTQPTTVEAIVSLHNRHPVTCSNMLSETMYVVKSTGVRVLPYTSTHIFFLKWISVVSFVHEAGRRTLRKQWLVCEKLLPQHVSHRNMWTSQPQRATEAFCI